MKNFLLPSKKNNYTPHLLRRSALIIYLVVILFFNLTLGQLDISKTQAAVDAGALYSLHNSNRAANGLSGLSVNSQLVTSATNKAQAMLNSNCWSHYCPPGTSPWSFILGAGYEYVYAGENLGEGFSNSSTLMNAWMNSPTHRANVLNGNFTEIGIGFAYGNFQGNQNNTIVVVHFGSKGSSSPTATPVPQKQITNNSPQTQPNNSNPPQNLPEPTNIPDVKVDSPKNNSFINDNTPEISGTKPLASELDILVNNKSIGRVESGEATFSYRPEKELSDGKKSLQAKAYINNNLVSESKETVFTVDTEAPEIDEQSIQLNYSNQGDRDLVTISLKTLSEADKVTTNVSSSTFEKKEDGIWELDFDKKDLPEGSSLIVTSEDKAGNKSVLDIPGDDILGYFDHSLFLSRDFDPNSVNTTVSGSLVSGFAGDVQTSVNMIFLLFLFVLFMLDFYVLRKSGLTGVKRNKSHLNLSIVAVVLIVIVIGGFGGSVL